MYTILYESYQNLLENKKILFIIIFICNNILLFNIHFKYYIMIIYLLFYHIIS